MPPQRRYAIGCRAGPRASKHCASTVSERTTCGVALAFNARTPRKGELMNSEDARFFTHGGVDWHELAQARATAQQQQRPMRGASPLTPQLGKNLFLTTHPWAGEGDAGARARWAALQVHTGTRCAGPPPPAPRASVPSWGVPWRERVAGGLSTLTGAPLYAMTRPVCTRAGFWRGTPPTSPRTGALPPWGQ
jgi:Transglycosylase